MNPHAIFLTAETIIVAILLGHLFLVAWRLRQDHALHTAALERLPDDCLVEVIPNEGYRYTVPRRTDGAPIMLFRKFGSAVMDLLPTTAPRH